MIKTKAYQDSLLEALQDPDEAAVHRMNYYWGSEKTCLLRNCIAVIT